MSEGKPRFQRKWQAVLYELFKIFRFHRWDTFSIKEAWHCSDRRYLKECGVQTYRAFEHHMRRLEEWDYLYLVPNPQKPLRHYPIPDQFLLSRSAINKLERQNVIDHKDAAYYKKVIGSVAYDLGIPIR